MYKVFLIIALLVCGNLFAQTTDIELKPGSVLVYNIIEGKKTYQYTVTLKEWKYDEKSFTWKTNEKPKANEGTVEHDKYYNLSSYKLNVGVGKKGINKLTEANTFLLAPTKLQDYLLEDEDTAEFTVIENDNEIELDNTKFDYDAYLETDLIYNGKKIKINYASLNPKNKEPELGFTIIKDEYNHFLCFYKSKSLAMKLISVKTPVIKVVAPSTIKTTTVNTQLKMTEAKLKEVKKAFPMLAKLEEYDVTNKGTDPKPFDETYDFRLTNKSTVPPSAIDCFTADLQILYKQKDKHELASLTTPTSKNSLPNTVAEKLIGIYKTKQARSIPGYKPWTHWKFVKSLSDTQIIQLAKDLEGYIKKYGFTE